MLSEAVGCYGTRLMPAKVEGTEGHPPDKPAE
jgi:hypothetical protein